MPILFAVKFQLHFIMQMMDENGNEAAAQKYLVSVPVCYRRPDTNAPQ